MRYLITLLGLLCLICQAQTTVGKEGKILTYNVLADKQDAQQRLPKLFQLMKKSDADIIALQEAAPWFITELEKLEWVKKYHFPKQKNITIAPRGLLILSKEPISMVDFGLVGGRQGRAYLLVETKIQEETFAVATCHLESFLESGPVRAKQMEIFFDLLKKQKNALFLGDFNFGDSEPEEQTIPSSYKDCWQKTNPKQAGFTWNKELSPMARQGSFPNEKSRRLDRVLLKSNLFTPSKSVIIGNTPVNKSKSLFPSDHFGLLCTINTISLKK